MNALIEFWSFICRIGVKFKRIVIKIKLDCINNSLQIGFLCITPVTHKATQLALCVTGSIPIRFFFHSSTIPILFLSDESFSVHHSVTTESGAT